MSERLLETVVAGEVIAPCKEEGVVITQDEETREGCCNCSTHQCLVDSRNVVTETRPIVLQR